MKYIELSQLIMSQLNLDTSTSDVLEYMLLEKANVLGQVKNSNILCRTNPDSHSNMRFDDDIQRSVIVYGFNEHSDDQQTILKEIQSSFYQHISNCDDDREAAFYRTFENQISLIVPNEVTKDAINSSSLIKAAGNIEQLNDKELKSLKEGVLLYKVNDLDDALNELVTALSIKIDTLLEKNVPLFAFFKSPILDNKQSDLPQNSRQRP